MIALDTQVALLAPREQVLLLAQALLRGRAGPWSPLGEAIAGQEGEGCALPKAC